MATVKKNIFRYGYETPEDRGTWSQDASMMKFYQGKAWRKLRAWVLANEPLCRECKKNGTVTEAEMVDHIKPIRLGGDEYDTDNLQPLCHSCHNIKSARERWGR